MMLYGYGGHILRIDLSSRSVVKEPLSEELARGWLGGRGFVSRILWEELTGGVDPLGPDNMVVMASGPLAGCFLPGSGKIHFGTKSPATGGYGDSNMGGHLAAELKHAGYDMVIFRGRANSPVLLVVDDGRVELRDASPYWGMGSIEAEEALKNDLGQDFQVATVGPAAENLVLYACVTHDFGRQAGRTGVGTVLGSKNVKALAVRGTGTIPLFKPREAWETGKQMFEACFANPGLAQWTPQGTAGVTDWVNEVGAFPTRNFSTSYFEGHGQINGRAVLERLVRTHKGCHGCPTPCGKYGYAESRLGEAWVEGPEYETIALVGGDCGLDNIEDIAYLNHVMDDLGIDTISGGAVIAFAIECYQQGLLSRDAVGRELSFGDPEAVLYLARKIAAREGIGDLLARGVKEAARRLGPEAERIAPHIKGLEISGYESRYAPAMMLAYMTCDIGAHHNRAWAITYDVQVGQDRLEGKAQRVIELQHVRPLFDALGVCRLQWVEIGFDLKHYADVFPLITGWGYSWEDLLRISEKIWNQNRCFNVREVPGFGRAWDYPPPRVWEEPVPTGPSQGKLLPRDRLDALLDDYYHLRGWSQDGLPTRRKLRELGLEDVAAALADRLPE